MLATRLDRLLTLMFSRTSGFKHLQPKILYLLQAKTGQSHTVCTLSSISYPHSLHSCLSICHTCLEYTYFAWSIVTCGIYVAVVIFMLERNEKHRQYSALRVEGKVVSGLPIGPIFKGQAVLLERLDPCRWDWCVVPKRRYKTTWRCITTQKTEDFISTTAET